MKNYIKKLALMIPQVKRRYMELEDLRGKINTYETQRRQYRSCFQIERFSLNFNGRIDTEGKLLRLCCEPLLHFSGVNLYESAEETIKIFARERADIIAESVKFSLLNGLILETERKFTSECSKCTHFRKNYWGDGDGLIHYINLSMYPAPCQCRCIYCSAIGSGSLTAMATVASYEKVFDVIDWAQKNGMIAEDAAWQVSSGEITIHPYKDKIFDLVKEQAVTFFTNCFIYDEKIAANLGVNPRSQINLSIDAGTPETWHKVKGVDNFEIILANLGRYFASSARPGQITFKYIILPGINDNEEDYSRLIAIMKCLKINHLDISSDVSNKTNKYSLDPEQREPLLRAAGALTAMLYKNGMKSSMNVNAYSPEEAEKVVVLADELVKSREV